VEYANAQRVWIVSPTTLMAVLNTARAVLKDVETRKQIHVIKEALGRLAIEFGRFDERLNDLARHIRQAGEDVEKIQITGTKITQQFQRIESAELEPPEGAQLKLVGDDGKAVK
jgi:DNA recombination protein RmuC